MSGKIAYETFQKAMGTLHITHAIPGAKEDPKGYSVEFDKLPPWIQEVWNDVAEAVLAKPEIEYKSPADRARHAPGYDKPERYVGKRK